MAADVGKTGEILSMFIFEAESMLRSFESVLANAQSSKAYTLQQLNELFRVMHTLKGSSAMMGFEGMRDSAHKVEDMLSVCRDMNGEGLPFERLSGALYKAVAAYRQSIEELSSRGTVPNGFEGLDDEVTDFVADYKKPVSEEKNVGIKPEAKAEIKREPARGESRFRVRLKQTQLPCIRALVILKALKRKCESVSSVPQDPGKHPECAESIEKDGFIVLFKPNAGVSEDDVRALILNQVDVESCETEKETADSDVHGAGVKLVSVDQNKLSRQIELLGELSATQSILEKLLEGAGDENTDRLLSQSRKYINYISETAIAMNMVTAESLFFRLRMLVRDISSKLGKGVELVLEGGDEPIERNMVESLYDPLMHMIRNCIDHGIESPEERNEKGKSKDGRITVSIESRRYDVVIRVSDDGRGIDPDRILDKAIEKGIARADREYSAQEIYDILLSPGFSTNENVTEYSGRGVGLDVVNRSVRQMSGTLNVQSEPGAGTTFTITLPATLSMIEVIDVEAGDNGYVIPTSAVKRLYGAAQMPEGYITTGEGDDKWVFAPENESPCPLVDLGCAIDRRKTVGVDKSGAFITVRRQSGDIALRADKLNDIVTVVIKPLPDLVRCQPQSEALYSGCTVMPDGKIALVIDVSKLAPDKAEPAAKDAAVSLTR